jgi:DNA modification methylase
VTASWSILEGDCRDVLRSLDDGSVQTCVTSPPYFGLRDYGHDGQIGLEPTPDEFVAALVGVFREVRRVLRDDGTVWLNLGDSYNNRARVRPSSHQPGLNSVIDSSWSSAAARAGCRMSLRGGDLKEKDLLGIPWMTAFALRADGWYLRSDIIWSKPACMPESVTDRPTRAHEYLFLLSKSSRYFYNADAIRGDIRDWSTGGPGTGIADTSERYGAGNGGNGGLSELAQRYKNARGEDGRELTATGERHTFAHPKGPNKRSVWTVPLQPYPGAHFATFPPKLIEPCILAGCPEHRCAQCRLPVVLDSHHARTPETRTTDSDLRGMPEGVSTGSGEPNGTLLLEGVCEPAHGSQPSLDTGLGQECEGVHPRQGAGSSDGGSRRVRDAASTRDGDASRSIAQSDGDRPSQERPQGRQSHRELGDPGQVEPRQDLETAPAADHLPPLRRKDQGVWTCPACGSHEVAPSLVLDPFAGAGTTGMVALRHGRSFVGIELSADYVRLARGRIIGDSPLLNTYAEFDAA